MTLTRARSKNPCIPRGFLWCGTDFSA